MRENKRTPEGSFKETPLSFLILTISFKENSNCFFSVMSIPEISSY